MLLITENMAVFAPMPSASAETATTVKAGLWRSKRSACRTSFSTVSIWYGSPYMAITRFQVPGLRSAAIFFFSFCSPYGIVFEL